MRYKYSKRYLEREGKRYDGLDWQYLWSYFENEANIVIRDAFRHIYNKAEALGKLEQYYNGADNINLYNEAVEAIEKADEYYSKVTTDVKIETYKLAYRIDDDLLRTPGAIETFKLFFDTNTIRIDRANNEYETRIASNKQLKEEFEKAKAEMEEAFKEIQAKIPSADRNEIADIIGYNADYLNILKQQQNEQKAVLMELKPEVASLLSRSKILESDVKYINTLKEKNTADIERYTKVIEAIDKYNRENPEYNKLAEIQKEIEKAEASKKDIFKKDRTVKEILEIKESLAERKEGLKELELFEKELDGIEIVKMDDLSPENREKYIRICKKARAGYGDIPVNTLRYALSSGIENDEQKIKTKNFVVNKPLLEKAEVLDKRIDSLLAEKDKLEAAIQSKKDAYMAAQEKLVDEVIAKIGEKELETIKDISEEKIVEYAKEKLEAAKVREAENTKDLEERKKELAGNNQLIKDKLGEPIKDKKETDFRIAEIEKYAPVSDLVEKHRNAIEKFAQARENYQKNFSKLKTLNPQNMIMNAARDLLACGKVKKGMHINTKEFDNMSKAVELVSRWGTEKGKELLKNMENPPASFEKAIAYMGEMADKYDKAKAAQTRSNPSALRIVRLSMAKSVMELAEIGAKSIEITTGTKDLIRDMNNEYNNEMEVKDRVKPEVLKENPEIENLHHEFDEPEL